jgi:hypothetical protein
MNLPDSQFLAAPLWLVTLLHLVTLTLHFVAMNFLLGGVIVVLYAAVKKRWDDPTLMRFVRLFPMAMAATVTLGVAPLLFLQLVYPRQIYAAAIISGWFWLGVIGAVIVAYYALYRASMRGERTGKVSKAALGVAVLGLLYVSLVYSSVFSMAERPELMATVYAQNQAGTTVNPAVADYGLRWLHMLLGAITVGGFFVGWLGQDRPEVYRIGKHVFIGGTVAASMAGMFYLVTLKDIMLPFMKSPGIWAVMAGMMLSVAAIWFFWIKRFWLAALSLFVSMLGMVYARHTVRLLRLDGTFDPASWRVATQWSPLVLFLVCFVIMLAVVAWMLRLLLVSGKAAQS